MNENKSVLEIIKSWSVIAGAVSVVIMCSTFAYLIIAEKIKENKEEDLKDKETFSIKFKRPDSLKSYSQVRVRLNGIPQYFDYDDIKYLEGDTVVIPLKVKEFRRPTVVNKAVLYHYKDWGLRLDIFCDERVNLNNSIAINVDYISDSLYASRVSILQSKSDSILNVLRSIEGGLGAMANVGWIFENDSVKNK